MANKFKTVQVKFYVTPEDKEKLDEALKLSGDSRQDLLEDFVRKYIKKVSKKMCK